MSVSFVFNWSRSGIPTETQVTGSTKTGLLHKHKTSCFYETSLPSGSEMIFRLFRELCPVNLENKSLDQDDFVNKRVQSEEKWAKHNTSPCGYAYRKSTHDLGLLSLCMRYQHLVGLTSNFVSQRGNLMKMQCMHMSCCACALIRVPQRGKIPGWLTEWMVFKVASTVLVETKSVANLKGTPFETTSFYPHFCSDIKWKQCCFHVCILSVQPIAWGVNPLRNLTCNEKTEQPLLLLWCHYRSTRVDSRDLQMPNISIWRYHCSGEVAFLKIWNQYWLLSDTVHPRIFFISPAHLQT